MLFSTSFFRYVLESKIIQKNQKLSIHRIWHGGGGFFTNTDDHGIPGSLLNGASPSAPYRVRFDTDAYEWQIELHDVVKCFAGCAKAHRMVFFIVFSKGLNSSRRNYIQNHFAR